MTSPDTDPHVPTFVSWMRSGLVHRAVGAVKSTPLSDLQFETTMVHLLLGLSTCQSRPVDLSEFPRSQKESAMLHVGESGNKGAPRCIDTPAATHCYTQALTTSFQG